MSFTSWLQNLRSALVPSRGQRHHGRRGSLRATAHRLNVEALEDRLTPSLQLAGYYPGAEWGMPLPLYADVTSDGIADQIVVPSTHVVDSFAPWPDQARKLLLIPYGVALDQFPLRNGAGDRAVRTLREADGIVRSVALRKPTLDDVYLRLTGARLAG